jgi:hypothetical protein
MPVETLNNLQYVPAWSVVVYQTARGARRVAEFAL